MFKSWTNTLKLRTAWTRVRFSSHITDVAQLNTAIDKGLVNPSQEAVVNLLASVRKFQSQTYQYEKFENHDTHKLINESIARILNNENVVFDNGLLEKILKMNFLTSSNLEIIRVYYNRQPKGIIDKNVALIPFRKSLFDGDLKSALTITDMTTGHPNYVLKKDKEFKSGIFKLIATSIGISVFSKYGIDELISFGIVGEAWTHFSSINSLIITYIINSSFLMAMVRFGRTLSSSGGDYLKWQKGTFYSYWYKHADEMMMCSKIVEADIKLNKGGISGGGPSPELTEELCRVDPHNNVVLKPGITRDGKKVRLLEMRDNLEDLKLQAYWMSGGDGFEWVEPDQDPAELIWQENLKRHGELPNHDVKSIKWAEKLIE